NWPTFAPPQWPNFTPPLTAARIGTAASWNARIKDVRANGLVSLVHATAERWFMAGFGTDYRETVEAILGSFATTSVDGYTGCCAALAEADFRGQLALIMHPLLAISGDDDPVCPPADLKAIADAVQNGHHLSLPGRHIVNLESASRFNAALKQFLQPSATPPKQQPESMS
ncbi:MAG TPA: hypothetical protein PKC09_14560, partial [Paracoccus sp. (in: a-proteobacteria)]|nr:hypothetical protein [Paracoccus sp. (in: a-proteobacteria)]HMR37607.1 hypothetical protein [Paracoccus sp. (in: a-proteobacteria)]